jgi:hypothetical protein
MQDQIGRLVQRIAAAVTEEQLGSLERSLAIIADVALLSEKSDFCGVCSHSPQFILRCGALRQEYLNAGWPGYISAVSAVNAIAGHRPSFS